MSNALLLVGVIIAIGGKLVAVAHIAITHKPNTYVWTAFVITGYLMALAGALSGGGFA